MESPTNRRDDPPGLARAPQAPDWCDPIRTRVDEFLDLQLAEAALPEPLGEALRYALLKGGKRLRPILAILCAESLGGSIEDALPAAAGVEMIHAFSLVHDDLPALDNDDLRRGRPTVHVRYDEATAVLTGDALMSLAFQSVLAGTGDPLLGAALVRELAGATTRMIAGQVLDTLGQPSDSGSEAEHVRSIHRDKTGALIRASCVMGARTAATRTLIQEHTIESIARFGEAVGLMFQIVDDLIDVEQPSEHTGKKTAKDSAAGKLTWPGVAGLEGARSEVHMLTAEAGDALRHANADSDRLLSLVRYLAHRTR